MIEKTPFVKYNLNGDNENRTTFTVSLNIEQWKNLRRDMQVLKQPKPSTALKQLAELGSIVLHDPLTGHLLQSVLKNKQRMERLGIPDDDTNVIPK
jgi:hypothetical protein